MTLRRPGGKECMKVEERSGKRKAKGSEKEAQQNA